MSFGSGIASGAAGGGGGGNSFANIQPDLGTTPAADSSNDTVIFTSSEMDITGDAATDTITWAMKNAAVIAKVLTGYASGAGTVAAADTLLQAIQKLNGNQVLSKATADAALPSASFTSAAVTAKLLTGYVSAAGTVAATDSILQAIQKLNGNDAANIIKASGLRLAYMVTLPLN